MVSDAMPRFNKLALVPDEADHALTIFPEFTRSFKRGSPGMAESRSENWSTEALGTSAIIERRQCKQTVMVWGGICAIGKTPHVFIEQGVKIN